MVMVNNAMVLPTVQPILIYFAEGIKQLLGNKLIGVYLTGSLTYGGFDIGSSDIDFVIVLQNHLSQAEMAAIKLLHADIETRFPLWAQRIEGSYIVRDMLTEVLPPKAGRPYANDGHFWESAPDGNEWLLNLYFLRTCGITLVGPAPQELIPEIDIELVRHASLRDLYEEWLPKMQNPEDLRDSHVQVYAVLTMCRVLHRMHCDDIVSKRGAATWVKRTYGEPWVSLIEQAEQWQYGQAMDKLPEVIEFIRFVIQKAEMKDEIITAP